MSETASPINATQIEDAAVTARMRGNGHFSLQDVLKLLPGRKTKALTERTSRMLECDDSLFNDDQGNYTGRCEFFDGCEFVITPNEYEIEEGILFPGHRFTAFMSAEVFPSEATLKVYRGGEVSLQEITGELAQFFPYHLLMGSEQVFDFFIAESPKNAKLAHGAKAVEKITLHVFDLKDFYEKNDFTTGDALLCKVKSWQDGVFEFRYLSGEKRSSGAIRKWEELFDAALCQVIDRFDNFFDIPEQLAWAFFLGDKGLRDGKKAASLDEFIRSTKAVEINFDAGHASLVRRMTAVEMDDVDLGVPEGVTVSRGETDSLAGLLADAGVTVSSVEIDSYILDCCHFRELDFETFFARCFGREPIDFADEAQEAVFLNYVEDRWEELTGNYNRVDDEPKAELRSQILEIIDSKSEFLQEFKGKADAGALPEEEMRRLAELSVYLDEVLRLLNSPAHTLAEGEAEEMAETIAGVGETQDALIQKIEEQFQ